MVNAISKRERLLTLLDGLLLHMVSTGLKVLSHSREFYSYTFQSKSNDEVTTTGKEPLRFSEFFTLPKLTMKVKQMLDDPKRMEPADGEESGLNDEAKTIISRIKELQSSNETLKNIHALEPLNARGAPKTDEQFRSLMEEAGILEEIDKRIKAAEDEAASLIAAKQAMN